MRIGYAGANSYRAVIEHTKTITLGINEDSEAAIMEDATMVGPEDLPIINSCPAVAAILTIPDSLRKFNKVYDIQPGYAKTYLYGFIGPREVSDLLEMTFTTRFLTGDVGPQVGFVQGTGIACSNDVFLAIPALPSIIEGLQALDYRGEITLGITPDFRVCDIMFGHFTGGFVLYNELARNNIQDSYEFCVDVGGPTKLHQKAISVCTLLSYPKFPHDLTVGVSIKAPSSADKHLYRMNQGETEVAYSAAWGGDIFEAKRRCRKTIDNCAGYNKDIQHRIDYGYEQEFVLNHERWLQFGGTEKRVKKSR